MIMPALDCSSFSTSLINSLDWDIVKKNPKRTYILRRTNIKLYDLNDHNTFNLLNYLVSVVVLKMCRLTIHIPSAVTAFGSY